MHSIALTANGTFPKVFGHWLVLDPIYMALYGATLLWFAACSVLPNAGTLVFALLMPELGTEERLQRLEVWSQRHLESMAMCNEMLVDKTGCCAKQELAVEVICLSGLVCCCWPLCIESF